MGELTEADKATLKVFADLFFEVIKNKVADEVKEQATTETTH